MLGSLSPSKAITALGAAAMFCLLLMPSAASAQYFSEGYEFLKSVKDREGQEVTDALNEPGKGAVIVNSRDRTTGETALHIVTKRRDTAWIRFLTKRGGNPNIANKKGETPLLIASNLGYVEGVEALLKAGAKVDVSSSTGETPLINAVHRRDAAMVRLLLTNKANPDMTDNSGRSARDYVALLRDGDAVAEAFERADEKQKDEKKPQTYGPSF